AGRRGAGGWTGEGEGGEHSPARFVLGPPTMRAIAIIGFGIQGRRMAAALVAHPLFRIAAVWDPDETARTAAAGVAAATPADVGAIFADRAIDCVYVASPPRSHLD